MGKAAPGATFPFGILVGLVVMKLDEALAILKALDPASKEAFSAQEREAITTLGAAGWAGDIEPDDPRLQELPADLREHFVDVVKVMQTKRIIQ